MRDVGAIRYWYVRLTVAGSPIEPLLLRKALGRLAEQYPFLDSAEGGDWCAELCYWDEGESLAEVTGPAMGLWEAHRESAGLPAWEVVGLEVLEKPLLTSRGGSRPGPAGLPQHSRFPG